MSCELNNIYDICILQNQTFELAFNLKDDSGVPIDITNWSFTGSIKEQFVDSGPTVVFTSTPVTPESGSLKIALTATQTWGLTKPKYVYDVIGTNLGTSPTETLRFLQGKVSVKPGVTSP